MKIMICYDGSNVAKDAMDLAKQRAKILDGQIYLVRSMEGGPDVPKNDFDNAESELTELTETVFKEDDIDYSHIATGQFVNKGRKFPIFD